MVARRKGDTWYPGGMTAAKQQELELRLDFLSEGSYEAELYLDDPAGGPTALTRRKQSVLANDTLKVAMPRAGGFAARLVRTVR